MIGFKFFHPFFDADAGGYGKSADISPGRILHFHRRQEIG
jgi:hypothetical protein